MDEAFQREVDALQSSQQLHRQHGDSDGTDRQRNPQEDQAVGYGGGQQNQHGQQAQDGACDLEDKSCVGDQTGAEPDDQGDCQRYRRGEDFQQGFHGVGPPFYCSTIIIPGMEFFTRIWEKRGDSRSRRPVPHFSAASLDNSTSAASSSLSYSARRLSMSAS